MSQIGLLMPGAPPPPTGPVYYLEGNTGGQVPPDGTGTIFTEADPNTGLSVDGTPGDNTTTINQLQYSVQTTNNNQGILATFDLAVDDPVSVVFFVDFVVRRGNFTDVAGGTYVFTAYNVAGTAVISAESSSKVAPALYQNLIISAVPSGTLIDITVQSGNAAIATSDWVAVIRYILND